MWQEFTKILAKKFHFKCSGDRQSHACSRSLLWNSWPTMKNGDRCKSSNLINQSHSKWQLWKRKKKHSVLTENLDNKYFTSDIKSVYNLLSVVAVTVYFAFIFCDENPSCAAPSWSTHVVPALNMQSGSWWFWHCGRWCGCLRADGRIFHLIPAKTTYHRDETLKLQW